MTSASVLVTLAILAAGMAGTTAYLLKWAATARTVLRAAVVLFLLVMMTGMLVGAAIYEHTPTVPGAIDGLWAASGIMSASVFIVFVPFLREARAAFEGAPAYAPTPVRRVRAFLGSVIAATFANELVMGWAFQAAAFGPIRLDAGIPAFLLAVLVAPWFVFPMALEMGLSLYWLRREFSGGVRWWLGLQAVAMFCSPPSLPGLGWAAASALGASVAMAAVIGSLVVRTYRGEPFSRPTMVYLAFLLAAFGLMALGLAIWTLYGNLLAFGGAVALQMIVFLATVVAPERFRSMGGPTATCPSDPRDRGPEGFFESAPNRRVGLSPGPPVVRTHLPKP